MSVIFKFLLFIIRFAFKVIFAIFSFILIKPFSSFFRRDSRCHWSQASRFNTKMKYNSKQYDEFVWEQEVFKIAWENIPAWVVAPVKNTSKLIYTVGSSIKSDYNDLYKKWKIVA